MGLRKSNYGVNDTKYYIWMWSWTLLLLTLCGLRCVNTQDQSYYFSAGNSQNRFVPSSHQNTRQHSYLNNRNIGNSESFPPQPGSYQEQLLFIANDNKKQPQTQSLTSAAYSPFGAQYSQSLRNPDIYDISPRPFGVQLSPGRNLAAFSSSSALSFPLSSSSTAFGQPHNSFIRSKAIRPNNLGGFLQQQHQHLQPQSLRNNVPHQQSQFLAHFNEPPPTPFAAASAAATNSPSEKSKSGNASSARGGFVPNLVRGRFNDVPQTQQQQKVPFRNSRNRFQPSNAATTSTTSTEATSASSTKRFNRFGASRTTTQKSQPSSTQRTTGGSSNNNSGGFQPRRPVFISREINEPVNLRNKATNRPYQFSNTNRAKLLKQGVAASSVVAAGAAGAAVALKDDNSELADGNSDEYDETDLHATNHASNDSAADSLEKLELHEANETTEKATSTEVVLKFKETTPVTTALEQQTTELVTNNSDKAEEEASYSSSSESTKQNYSDSVDDVEPQQQQQQNLTEEATTAKQAEYEYEYEEENDSTEANVEDDDKPKDKQLKDADDEPKKEQVTEAENLETVATEQPAEEAEIKSSKTATLTTSTTTETPKIEIANKESEVDGETDDVYDDEEDYSEEDAEEDLAEEAEPDDIEETTTPKQAVILLPTTTTTSSSTTTTTPAPSKDILDREIISVVTTKSVVNGSTAFPSPVTPPGTTLASEDEDGSAFDENKLRPATAADEDENNTAAEKVETATSAAKDNGTSAANNATEGYVVIASIQTSRSINGARFLPFPAIEQEETKQPRSELERKIHGHKAKTNAKLTAATTADEEDDSIENSNEVAETTTLLPLEQSSSTSTTTASSTESIIDKLDRVQSELSSGLLSGKYPLLSEMDASTQSTSTTAGSSKFVPNIRKFQPKTTAAPKVKIHHFDETEMDDLAGLLPPGFKPRPSYKNRKQTTSTTTTTSTTNAPEPAVEINEEVKKPLRNSTIGRSFKNSPVTAQELTLAGLFPKGYKQPNAPITTEKPLLADIFSKLKFDDDNLSKLLPKDYKLSTIASTTTKPAVTLVDDISKFLPPGYKLKTTTSTTKKPSVELIHDDVSKFLPPGYKQPAYKQRAKDEEADKETKIAGGIDGIIPLKVDDISKLLPPGYKLKETNKPTATDDTADIFKKLKFKEVSSLLPADFNKNATAPNAVHPASTSSTSTSTTTSITTEKTETDKESASKSKVVFPKGIHKRIGAHRLTTPRTQDEVYTSPAVVIKKGPPTRATTEFTGWPTPSTTPISIEKLLEQAKTVSINFEDLLSSSTTSTTTTTTTTTSTTPKPTKPGHCNLDCDLAATIKIIDGVAWKPELLDHNTVEWKNLAREIEAELNEVYSNAPELKHWYKKVRIDSFSKGSVLVDYYVELANITEDVDTLRIKKLFHQALTQSPQPMLPQKPEIENETDNEHEMKDEPIKEEKLIKETFIMGKYVIDPVATDFSVIPMVNVEYAEEVPLIPHWAIVVIVIGVGGLAFVVVFGVTVLLNRQKRAKKVPIPLTNDMLNELKINHMGGADNYGVDDFYNIDDAWNDTKQPIKPKRFTNSMHGGSSNSNIYDSWRSTRNGGGISGADYFYDTQNIYSSQKGDDTLKRNHNHSHLQHQQHQLSSRSAYPPASHQFDAFADAHQMYTYNNHGGRSRYPRDYDPDF